MRAGKNCMASILEHTNYKHDRSAHVKNTILPLVGD